MVKNDSGIYNRRGYLKSDHYYDTKRKGDVKSAILRLFVSNVNTTPSRTISIYGTADKKWTETGINWNNAPIGSKKLGEMVISNADSNKWIELDITDYIKENISDNIVSLMIINENGPNSKFKHAK